MHANGTCMAFDHPIQSFNAVVSAKVLHVMCFSMRHAPARVHEKAD